MTELHENETHNMKYLRVLILKRVRGAKALSDEERGKMGKTGGWEIEGERKCE